MSDKRVAISSKFRRVLFISVPVFVLTLLLSVAADRITGAFLDRNAAHEGLIFPPESTLKFQTPEFDFTVNINALGLRDREFDLNKAGKTRIVAVGDSFTYGWGVAAEESWPKLLEARLRQAGHDAEVVNLGQPGTSPAAYAVNVDKAIPVLKPDLVIVGILQGEDLAQLGVEESLKSKAAANDHAPSGVTSLRLRARVGHLARRMYPNFLRLLGGQTSLQPPTALWKSQAEEIVEGFTSEEQSRFDKLDAGVRQAFLNGELNPSLIQRTVSLPRYFLDTLDADKPEVRSMISSMAASLAHIRETADRYGCEVIVVSIPHKVYASRRDLESCRRLGYELSPEMAESDSPDRAIESACRIAGVKFISVTDEFRKAAGATQLFYEMDGHYNPKGHQVFADLFTPLLLRQWHEGTL